MNMIRLFLLIFLLIAWNLCEAQTGGPVIQNVYGGPICVGTPYAFRVTTSCSNITWTASTGGTFENNIKTGSQVRVTWTSASTSAWIQANYTGCTTSSLQFTVNAAVTPSITISTSGSATVCQVGGNITLTASGTNVMGTPTYYWYLDNSTTPFASTSVPSYSFSVSGLSAGSHTAKVKVGTLSCSTLAEVTSPNTANFTVLAQTVITATVPESPSICDDGGTIPIMKVDINIYPWDTNLTYQWYVNGAPKSDNNPARQRPDLYLPTATTLHDGDDVYCVVSYNGSCVTTPVISNHIRINMTSKTTPWVHMGITAGPVYCSSQTITFTATTSQPISNFTWNHAGTTVNTSIPSYSMAVADYTTDINKYKQGDVVTVVAQGFTGCVNSSSATTTNSMLGISVGMKPFISVTGPVSFCEGTASTSLKAIISGGTAPGSYQWYKDGQPIAGATSVTYAPVVHGSFYVVTGYAQCNAISDPVSINLKPSAQAGNLSTNVSQQCLQSAIQISSSNGSGIPYYSVSSNGGQSWNILSHSHGGEATWAHTPSEIGIYRYMVIFETECGQSAPVYKDVVVKGKPDPIGINGPPNALPGKEYTYTVSSVLYNESYQWTVVNGTITEGQGTPTVKVKFNQGGGTMTVVTGNSTCGNASPYSITVREEKMNLIREETILRKNVATSEDVPALPVTDKSRTTTYFDGLGRNLQVVSWQSSPLKEDVATTVIVDGYGRQYKNYLPVIVPGKDGSYRSELVDTEDNYTITSYSDVNSKIAVDIKPYAITKFEQSPLNRVLKQEAPGNAWKKVDEDPNSTNDKTIKYRYGFNKESEVYLFVYDELTAEVGLGTTNYYSPNTLVMNKTIDEKNREVIEYSDKQGRTVCKKVEYKRTGLFPNEIVEYANTYYIYDDMGNLVVVLPPEGIEKLKNSLN